MEVDQFSEYTEGGVDATVLIDEWKEHLTYFEPRI
jgi:hypothetical protein